MKKSPTKVKLLRGTIKGKDTYAICTINGAITVGSYNGQILRAGDIIDEKQAEMLTRSYLVSVGATN